MSQEYYILFVDKIHVAVSLHESQKIFVGFGSMHDLPALSKFSSALGSTVGIDPYESNLCHT